MGGWRMTRKDGGSFNVMMAQYADVEASSSVMRMFTPEQQYAAAPMLERIAVISCPVEGPQGENMNELLNEKINVALDHATKCAEKRGWFTFARNRAELDA